jgi:hypothetical protein
VEESLLPAPASESSLPTPRAYEAPRAALVSIKLEERLLTCSKSPFVFCGLPLVYS